MVKRILRRRYVSFKSSRFSRFPLTVKLARNARDALFISKTLKDGVWGERVVETEVLDGWLDVDLADRSVSRTLYLNGVYESALTRACPDLVDDGGTVVDVGANIGYFTVLFSDAVGPSGTVYALEADPRNYELLERNVATRGCSNVTTEQVAVSDAPGTPEFALSDDQSSRSSVNGRTTTTGDVMGVDAMTLNDYVDLCRPAQDRRCRCRVARPSGGDVAH